MLGEKTVNSYKNHIKTLSLYTKKPDILAAAKVLKFYNCQLIGVFPIDIKISFVLEKGLQPKKPREADSGDGCGAVRT